MRDSICNRRSRITADAMVTIRKRSWLIRSMAPMPIGVISRAKASFLPANHWGRPNKVTAANRQELQRLKAQRREDYRQRIPIEGKFGQGTHGYRLNYIRAKRADTSAAWINSIFLVMDLLILLRIFFVLCKKAVAAALLPTLRLQKMLFCHRQRRRLNHCVLSQMPAL